MSVLGEIKYITERLIQCERDFTAAATGSVISEVGQLATPPYCSVMVRHVRLNLFWMSYKKHVN